MAVKSKKLNNNDEIEQKVLKAKEWIMTNKRAKSRFRPDNPKEIREMIHFINKHIDEEYKVQLEIN